MDSARSAPLACTINGRPMSFDAAEPGTTLLDFVRERGLTGAKEGCAEGECGACAVAVVVEDEQRRAAYRVVNSCLIGLPLAAGFEIYTVESLAEHGELCEVQRAMAAGGGSQCGYCTPGFVMSLFAEQYRRDRTGPCDPLALAGNLCRCTGYRPIRDAALSLGPPPKGAFRDRLERPAPRPGDLATDGFARPATIDSCIALLASRPDATLVAGNTDLGVEANLHERYPGSLVSLDLVPELREYSETDASIRIGAGLPLTDIGCRWKSAPEAVHEWLALFASPLIRNRATLGGNLATASPIGDAAPLLLALDARVHVAGPRGRRVVPLASFFTGYRRTAMHRGEVLTTVEIPRPLPAFLRFYKVARRRLDDISTVAAAMAVDRDATGRLERVRFAFGGVAATPVLVAAAEEAVRDRPWNEAGVGRVQHVLERTLSPLGDHRGSKQYRLEVAKSLVEKFWWESRP
jgi:xanthine dehydrogenase small subunit